MYSNKIYFIFGFGAGSIWVIMKLEHILGLQKKKTFVWCDFFYSSWENNQFRITIVNKLEFTNYYLLRGNNLNSLAVFMQLKMYIWEIPNRYFYNIFFHKNYDHVV